MSDVPDGVYVNMYKSIYVYIYIEGEMYLFYNYKYITISLSCGFQNGVKT